MSFGIGLLGLGLTRQSSLGGVGQIISRISLPVVPTYDVGDTLSYAAITEGQYSSSASGTTIITPTLSTQGQARSDGYVFVAGDVGTTVYTESVTDGAGTPARSFSVSVIVNAAGVTAPTAIQPATTTIQERGAQGDLATLLNDSGTGEVSVYTIISDVGGNFQIDGNRLEYGSNEIGDTDEPTVEAVTIRETNSAGFFEGVINFTVPDAQEIFPISNPVLAPINNADTALTITASEARQDSNTGAALLATRSYEVDGVEQMAPPTLPATAGTTIRVLETYEYAGETLVLQSAIRTVTVPVVAGAGIIEYPFDVTKDEGTAGDWFVDGDVASSGVGTSTATAFKTVQEAINAASAGDTISVLERAEPYRENMDWSSKVGTSGSPITIKGHGTDKPLITAFESLTGFVLTDAGDQTLLGNVDRTDVYKLTGVAKTLFPDDDPLAMNLHRNGVKMNMARLSIAEREYPNFLGDTDSYVDVVTTLQAGDVFIDYWTLTADQVAGFADGDSVGPIYAVQEPNAALITYATYDAANLRLTPDARSAEYENSALKDKITIFNTPARMREGEFAFVDQGTTVDIYVKSSGGTAGIEHSARSSVVDLNESTLAAEYIHFKSLRLTGASSASTNAADRGHLFNGGGTTGGNTGIEVDNVYMGLTERIGNGYGPVDLRNPVDFVMKNVVIDQAIGQFGMFIRGSTGAQDGTGWNPGSAELDQVLVINSESAPCRLYCMRDTVVMHTRGILCGLAAHANKGNVYEQGHEVLFMHSDFDSADGYLTCQETSDFNLWMVAGTQSYATDIGNLGRCVQDQNSALNDIELTNISGTFVDEEAITWAGGSGISNDANSNNSVFGANGIRVRMDQDAFPAPGTIITGATSGFTGEVVSIVGTKNAPSVFDNVANRPATNGSNVHFLRAAPYAPVSDTNDDSFQIGNAGARVFWSATGNIAHGYNGTFTSNLTAWDYNMSTADDAAIGGGFGANDYRAALNTNAEPSNMYEDFEHGNFAYAAGAAVRTEKVGDFTTEHAALKARFPQVPAAYWDEDINGDPFDPSDAYFGLVQDMTKAAVVGPWRRVKAPTLTNGGAVGDVLTCDIGFGAGYPWPNFTYQWQRSQDVTAVDVELIGLDNLTWTDIAGETADNYTLAAADVATRVRCVVTAVGANTAYGGVSSVTTTTDIVANFAITAPFKLTPTTEHISPGASAFTSGTFDTTAGNAIAVIVGVDNASDTAHTVSINGTNIPEAARRRRSTDMISIHFLADPGALTGADITVTGGANVDYAILDVFEVAGATGIGATADSGLTGRTLDLDVTTTAAGSMILWGSTLSVSGNDCAWTGATEILDSSAAGFSTTGSQHTSVSAAYTEAAAVTTYTGTPQFDGSSGAIAVIGVELLST